MKHAYLLISLSLVWFTSMRAQDNQCITAVAQIRQDSLMHRVRQLTGRIHAQIGTEAIRIASRYAFHSGNVHAANFIRQECLRYGFVSEEIPFSQTGNNVIMYKPGSTDPKKAFLLGAHYDCVGSVQSDFQGADDNASGVAALLETARVLQAVSFPYTLVLAFWDEEELGLFGSAAFAPDGPLGYWDVTGSIHLDMIAYDGNHDSVAIVHTKPVGRSEALALKVLDLNRKLGTALNLQVKNPGETATDHQSFWLAGATAVGLTEDYDNDFNPFWHQPGDQLEQFDSAYFLRISKLAAGVVCELSATATLTGLTAIKDLPRFEVFPNPATHTANMTFATPFSGTISLLNSTGKQLRKLTVNHAAEARFNLSEIPPGMYWIQVTDGQTQKLLILPQ